jgi:hypothetical protein
MAIGLLSNNRKASLSCEAGGLQWGGKTFLLPYYQDIKLEE